MNDRYSDGFQTVIGVRTAQVLGGYVGQLFVADEVIWQSNAYDKRDDGFAEAKDVLIEKMKGLFA